MLKVMLIANCGSYQIGSFFKNALIDLGYEYLVIDENKFFHSINQAISHKLIYRFTGHPYGYSAFNQYILQAALSFKPDAILVIKGTFLSDKTLSIIKTNTTALIVNYATDDPYNPVNSTPDLLASIPYYDIYACPRRAMMPDIQNAGCANVEFVPFGYEPSLHYPENPSSYIESTHFNSDVVFIGNADKDRKPILASILQIHDVNLHLHGAFWDKDKNFKFYARDFAFGRNYRIALGATQIALCLVRRANRDGHVMRSFEIPACGAFMLAERTEEHLSFFRENEEIACFSSNEELVDKVKYFLAHEKESREMAHACYQRVINGSHSYRDRLEQILKHVEDLRK